MQTLIAAIDTSLGSLFKASIFIRANTTRGKRLRAESTKPFDNRADIMYVNDRYPSLTQNATLVGRLGEANARRRQYFKYCRDHDERLSTVGVKDNSVNAKTQRYPEAGVSAPDKTVLTVEKKPSLLADTEATAFVANETAQMEMLRVAETPKAMSEVSFATSIADISDEGFSFPSVPVEAENGTPFLCPYCFRLQKLKRESLEYHWRYGRSWFCRLLLNHFRKHVLQDLEPYICTFSSCGLETFRSQHAWFEHELLIHRSRWVCSKCSAVFQSSHDLKEHVNQHHNGLVSKQQLSAFIDQSKRTVESIRSSECPFCDDSWARADLSSSCGDEAVSVNPDQFRRHVGKHLEQVALFSLPRLIQDQGKSIGPQNDADFGDRDDISIGWRWIRDDCGKGWSIVSRKRTTFIALAYVLNLRHALSVSRIPGSHTEELDIGQLEAALEQNNEELVLQQLRRGIDVDTQRERFSSMLREASRKGYTEVVRRLLDQGVNVNAESIVDGSALHLASFEGHGAVVGLLLDQGADVNMERGEHHSALQAASFQGHETIVRQLLDRGAEINALGGTRGGQHRSALQAASFQGHETIVQLLLDRGADINIQGGDYGSALQAACHGGTDHEAIVRLLLDQGAEMNVQVGLYGNALQTASFQGHETIVRLLLDRGMDVNMQGGYFGNALQAAVYTRRVQIVHLLLNHGATVNAQGGEFGNALQAAASSGVDEIIQVLLDRGANVNAQGGFHGNALQAAMGEKVSDNTVQLLLDRGASVNAQGGFNGNALQAAASKGREKIVRLLLEYGANVNAQGGFTGNPLQAAASSGKDEIVQLLLDHGANMDIQGGHFGNALQAAAYAPQGEVVQILLNHGADVNAQGGHFKTALEAARWRDSVNTMQILIDHGADPIGLDLTMYALITVTGFTMNQNTFKDQRFVIRLRDSVGHLKDRIIEKIPVVKETLAANPTWSVSLVCGDKVLRDENRSCSEAGVEHGSRLLCRLEKEPSINR